MPMPGSSTHFPTVQNHQPHYYGQQASYDDEWDDYEFVSPPPPLTQQQQNYRNVHTSSHVPQYQQQPHTPRGRQQHPQSHYPSPPYSYSHTNTEAQEWDYNYNEDDGSIDVVVPVYL
jgi:hypothetical protein